MGQMELNEKDREWLWDVYGEMLVKMKAECERGGKKHDALPI